MPATDKLVPLIPLAFVCIAALFVISALILIWQNRLGAAALSGALFFLSVVLAYFPQLDSINAWSIGVTLGHRIDRAEVLIEKIRTLSEATAQSSYYSLAWEGRWADQNTAKQKKAVIDAAAKEMKTIGISDSEQIQISKPLISLIANDLILVFNQTLFGSIAKNVSATDLARVSGQISESTPKIVELSRMTDGDLRRHFDDLLKQFPPPPRNVEPLRRLAEKLIVLLDECRADRSYSTDAANFLDSYSNLTRPAQYSERLDQYR